MCEQDAAEGTFFLPAALGTAAGPTSRGSALPPPAPGAAPELRPKGDVHRAPGCGQSTRVGSEGCSPGRKGIWDGGMAENSPHLPCTRCPRRVSQGRPWGSGNGGSPAPLPPTPQVPRQLPRALPISLSSPQTPPVTVTQINSSLLDLSGNRAALTCHKSRGSGSSAHTQSPWPRPAAHLPRSPVSR